MDTSLTTMEVDAPFSECTLDASSAKLYMEKLYSTDERQCYRGIVELKFAVIGSPRCKASVIEQGCVARLLQILKAHSSGLLLRTEVVNVLNSLAKGQPEHAASLVQAGVLPVLWEQLESCGPCNSRSHALQYIKVKMNKPPSAANTAASDDINDNTEADLLTIMRLVSNYTQILLCCLRSVYRQGCVPPPPSWNHKLLCTLIKYGYHPPTNQECVANILAYACKCEEQQLQLVSAGAGHLVAAMLASGLTKVQLPALHCLAALTRNNREVSMQLSGICHRGVDTADRLVQLLGSHGEPAVQLAAATALVWLHRGGALPHTDTRISNKTMQSLVRLCASDRDTWLRVEAAQQLAHLTELSPELQRTAAITDHLLTTLGEFLHYTPVDGETTPKPEHLSPNSCGQFDEPSLLPELMRESGLLVFATLAANNEEIRQKVSGETPTSGGGASLLDTVTTTLNTGSPAVQLAAIRCLHSLSRSVHSLRTTFQDHLVWKPLLDLVQNPNADHNMIVVALSTLCNLTLEFSPSKEHILEQGCVSHLCSLTRKDDYDLKLNSVWALMNIAYQSDITIKKSILHHLGTDQLFNLVSETDTAIVMKALGLLRNLLSPKQDIDTIMRQHGNQIMQYMILILEGQYSTQVKEQALCILTNIADGDTAKEFILGNDDILKKLFNYMVMPKVELQMASMSCIGNLASREDTLDTNALDRQARLKEMKLEEILESLLAAQDSALYDKVRYILDQFKLINGMSSSGSSTASASNGSPTASSTATTANWRAMDQ